MISLGAVATAPFGTRVAVLAAIAAIMTVGVYGLVAGIVKLDDAGLWLVRRGGAGARALGATILKTAPWLMKALSVAGTAAMFLVGGGILVHGLPVLHHLVAALAPDTGWWGPVGTLAAEAVVGVVAGALVLGTVTLGKRVLGAARPA